MSLVSSNATCAGVKSFENCSLLISNDSFQDSRSTTGINYSIPGNRLVERWDNSIEIVEKTFIERIGQFVLRPMIDVSASVGKYGYDLLKGGFNSLNQFVSKATNFLPGAEASVLKKESDEFSCQNGVCSIIPNDLKRLCPNTTWKTLEEFIDGQDDLRFREALTDAYFLEPDELLPLLPIPDGERVTVVTLVADIPFTKHYKHRLEGPITLNTTWFTIENEFQKACLSWNKRDQHLQGNIDEFLGLAPNSKKVWALVMKVERGCLERPCFAEGRDTNDNLICVVPDESQENHPFCKILKSVYIDSSNPNTRAGYTHNRLVGIHNDYGATELIIRKETNCTVTEWKAFHINDYCSQNHSILGGGVTGFQTALKLVELAKKAELNNFQVTVFQDFETESAITRAFHVTNWPNRSPNSGDALLQQLRAEAIQAGVRVVNEKVISVIRSNRNFIVITKDRLSNRKSYRVYSAVIATGSIPRELEASGAHLYQNKGIYDSPINHSHLKGKNVAIYGGGPAAESHVQALLHYQANQITVIVRGQSQMLINHPKVQVLTNTKVTDTFGINGTLTAIKTLDLQTNQTNVIQVDALFKAIGLVPNTRLFANSQKFKLDKDGFIVVNNLTQQTSVDCIYAVGDVEKIGNTTLALQSSERAAKALMNSNCIK